MIEIVWLTDQRRLVPHFKECADKNPWAVQHLHVAPPSKSFEHGWRNCDNNIRNFWREKRLKVRAPYVLFLEYDVRVNTALDLDPQPGVGVAQIKKSHQTWIHFNETELSRIPLGLRSLAMGVVPLAVTLWDRESLDKLLDPFLDSFFQLDVFSELRIGTCLNIIKAPCYVLPLPYVGLKPTLGEEDGIHHPVKNNITDALSPS